MQRLPLNGLSFFLAGFFFHRYWQFTRQQEKGGDHRHSYLPPLHGNTFNYWNATRWDLPPGEIIIWLIDYDWIIDGMLLSVYLMICNTLHKFWDQSSSPIINVACKHPREVLGTSFSGVTLPICYNIEQEEGAWFLSAKWTIPQFPYIFPRIDVVSIIYVWYCSSGFHYMNLTGKALDLNSHQVSHWYYKRIDKPQMC